MRKNADMPTKKSILIGVCLLLLFIAIAIIFAIFLPGSGEDNWKDRGIIGEFNGERAMRNVEYQVSLGPRTPGNPAHSQVVEWIVEELASSGWQTSIQETQYDGYPIRNVIGRLGEGQEWIILGAHYDTRLFADNDPNLDNRQSPVPGANDGASGVAVLLEIARCWSAMIESQSISRADSPTVWLVFFDAEDNGNLEGREWIMGSRAFVSLLDGKPDAVVVIDMIGDADLNIYKEKNSNASLTEELWGYADDLGYSSSFIPEYKYRIIDDHLPFIEAGINAVDIIDFDYAYWHTVQDTPDKVSSNSMQIVGKVLLEWLKGK